MTARDWLTMALATASVVGPGIAWALGRRGRSASASRDEADAAESLSGSVIALGKRLDEMNRALWDAWNRLALAEQRATAAENRAAAAELRAATADAELVRLRAEVAQLRQELSAYEVGRAA